MLYDPDALNRPNMTLLGLFGLKAIVGSAALPAEAPVIRIVTARMAGVERANADVRRVVIVGTPL
jgi:hypothetical protein